MQVIGLLRWPILVPGYAADGDTALRDGEQHPRNGDRRDARLRAHRAWTALVITALGRSFAGRWFASSAERRQRSSRSASSRRSSLPVVDEANFLGYVLYSVWLIAFGVVLLARERRSRRSAATRLVLGAA